MTASSSSGDTWPIARSWSTALSGIAAGADELLRPFGELEQLDPGGDARPRPPERLGGAVLRQPAIGEHRLNGLGLLVWVELLTGDVLDRPVGVLAVDVADLGVDVGLAELLVRGELGDSPRRARSRHRRLARSLARPAHAA